ncbi:DUF1684 domain-containing protein [Jatrophihabitans sp.]|uniref:DUF1684 domain-containing protein n=1 Tax=Jatrophihabitans sp. TaxID=1932789 RepID=UPI0030C705A2|nr:uncharacterized protein [Jatrophihabitans sp.]
MASDRLQLTSWRRTVARLYAEVRAQADPAEGHAIWRAGRDDLFRNHPQSPLTDDDPLRDTGVPYWPYDPALRFTLELRPAAEQRLAIPTSSDGDIVMKRIGRVELPGFHGQSGFGLDVWWLDQYGGGLFLPLRDGTAAHESYGAGRYLLDSAKGADLGGDDDSIVVDLNFAYHPSCRYNYRWECPLAQEGNRTEVRVEAGERLS